MVVNYHRPGSDVMDIRLIDDFHEYFASYKIDSSLAIIGEDASAVQLLADYMYTHYRQDDTNGMTKSQFVSALTEVNPPYTLLDAEVVFLGGFSYVMLYFLDHKTKRKCEVELKMIPDFTITFKISDTRFEDETPIVVDVHYSYEKTQNDPICKIEVKVDGRIKYTMCSTQEKYAIAQS